MTDFTKKIGSFWQDGINVLLGLWLIAAPWALGYLTVPYATWNAWVVGGIVAVAALAALISFHRWEEWINMALGAWLIVSPWLLGYASLGTPVWNQVAVGILVAALAVWSSTSEHEGGGLFSQS